MKKGTLQNNQSNLVSFENVYILTNIWKSGQGSIKVNWIPLITFCSFKMELIQIRLDSREIIKGKKIS